MNGQRGTLELLARHLVLAVEPVREAVSDLEHFRVFTYRLGWHVTMLPAVYQELAGIVDSATAAAAALPDDPDVEDVLRLLHEVRRLHEALNEIAEVPDGVDAGDAATFLAELAERAFELLLTDYLAAGLPTVFQAATMLGVVQTEHHPRTTTRPAFLRTRLRLDQLSDLISNPGSLAAEMYGWGTPRFRFELVRDHVFALLWALGRSTFIEPVEPELAAGYQAAPPEQVDKPIETRVRTVLFEVPLAGRYVEVGMSLAELPAEDGLPAGVIIQPAVPAESGPQLALDEQWTLRIRADTDPAALFGLLIRPGSLTVRFPLAPGTPPPPAGFGVTLAYTAATPEDPGARVLLLGRPGGSRVELAGASVGFRLDLVGGEPEVTADATTAGLAVVVSAADLDGFIGGLLGGDMTAPLPLTVRWSNKTGIGFVGGSGFQVSLPSNLRLGPVTVQQIQLALSATRTPGAAPDLILEAGASLSGQLGPLAFSVDNVGLQLVSRFTDGNAGPFDIGLGFKPPTGAGLSIDAAGVSGGGFLRFYPDIGRYDGALVLKLTEITVAAFGLVETRLPGGARGFSLAILMRGEFPPIQVGLGFVLTAVGGLIALNRRVDVDALRHRLASGTAGRILAPEDPIRNAPSLLADLGTVFPAAPGITVIGPTVQLVWADLVRFDIGVFFELPGPERVVVLGSARASIEKPDGGRPYLVIRFDVVGVIDLQAGTVAFDAVLIDSQLLEILDLTGGAAFRLSWGNQPYAVLTVGGFNPAYNPEPLAFPSSLTRIAMVRGDPSDSLYLRFEGYFAVTTNTYQFGAAVEALINARPFHIQGILQFDALIRRQPFHFQFDIRASVRVRYKTRNLGGLTLTGVLSGPGPVILRARVCIEILFFDICFEDTFTLGSSHPPAVTAIASAVAALTEELDNPANLRVSETVDRYVALRPSPPDLAQPVVSPLGQLLWVQHRAPLDLLLQRIGGAPLEEPQMVEATSLQLTEAELDWFAPGSFADLTDAEALNRRAFERLTGGLRFGAPGTDDGPAATLQVTVRQIRLPAAPPSDPVRGVSFPAWLTEATFARIGGITDVAVTPAVAVHEEPWTVADAAGGVVAAGISAAQAHQLAALGPAGVAAAATDRIAVFTF